MKTQAAAVQGEEAGEMVPLSVLRAGESGRVSGVLGNGELVHRLREMGLIDGVKVRMIRPGRPCIIGLAGQRLGFRGDDLAHVLVRVPVSAMAS